MTSSTQVETNNIQQFLSVNERQEFEGYEVDFENLALEGGGCAGIAHIGAIRVLEELGYLNNIKRFAGSSAGALVATMLALGYNSDEIEEVIQRDFKPIIYDGCWWPCRRLVNLIWRLGAYPGRKLEELIAKQIEQKTRCKDYTFKQLYNDKQVELCILATDLSKRDTVYFHVKTTPDMPIYLAARASSSLPGLLEPVKWKTSFLVDGGVLCNYPVHAYDGWYLSKERGDQFLTRYSDLANMGDWTTAKRFGAVNEKTLGVMIYPAAGPVLMKDHMEKRTKTRKEYDVERPDTKLSRTRPVQQAETTEVEKMTAALDRLFTVLDRADLDRNGIVSKQEFRAIWASRIENGLTQEDIKLLFGTVRSKNIVNAIFNRIDTQQNNKIEHNEIETFAEQQGVDLAQTRRGYENCNVGDIKEFVTALLKTVMLHAQRVTAKSSDCSRTIGINTGYLGTFDWSMEPDDKDFLIKRGKQAALCFLREHKEITRRTSGEASGSHTSSHWTDSD